MNLNAREKLVLVVVLVIIIWIAGIITFIKPSIDDVKAAQNTLDAKNVELAEKRQRIEDDKNLKEDIRKAYDKANETGECFYPRMVQHDAATKMQDLLDINGDDKQEINNDAMSVSATTVGSLNKYIFTQSEVKATLENIVAQVDGPVTEQATVPTSTAMTAYNFSFHFKATKEDVLTFMENLINEDKKSMVIDSFAVGDVGDNEDKSEWEANMSLTMFMIPQLKDPDIVNAQIEQGMTVNALDGAIE